MRLAIDLQECLFRDLTTILVPPGLLLRPVPLQDTEYDNIKALVYVGGVWNPNGSSTGEGPYRLPSFDARRIIYPGANGDAWWDMPQLIAQVSVHLHLCGPCPKTNSTSDKRCNFYI